MQALPQSAGRNHLAPNVGFSQRLVRAAAFAVALAAIVHVCGTSLGAQSSPPLDFFKNYFVTGDYAVGGASLWQRGVGGVATAQITMPAYNPATREGVPPGVDIVAAFLYVQTAEATTVPGAGIHHARFNGYALGPADNSLAQPLAGAGNVRACWTVNFPGGRRLVTYRTDVLRFLPLDAQNKFNAAGPHTVSVPDAGAGLPDEGGSESTYSGARAIGTSLVIVYRDPSRPLRSVVIYDGAYTKQPFSTMSLPIAGFYQAADAPQARLTPIVGDGRPFFSERLRLDSSLIATNPFASSAGAKWDNPTYGVPLPAGASATTMHVTPNGLLSDCLMHSAVVLSTDVQDTDEDGLLDVWESSTTTLTDPKGRALPNLHAMGADPLTKDVFVEIGAMDAPVSLTYGGVAKPPHTHGPRPEALRLIGEAFANAPTPIAAHFDIGPWAGSAYDDPAVSRFLVPDDLARGGEPIDERNTVCTRTAADPTYVCQFSGHPGTVGWKSGFRFLRDEVLSISGPALPAGADPEDYCDQPGYSCVRRFDENRFHSFRYALFAHAVGLPKSELACLSADGTPVDSDAAGFCPAPLTLNPDFATPRTNTGIGDFPGADLMVTLGAFDDVDGLPVGTPFMQASTLMHEMGHGFERRHGGEAFEPNCKPTYLSVMNYLYQLRGLLDDTGTPHVNFSSNLFAYPSVDENMLADGFVAALPYRIGYYAPLATSYLASRTLPVTRHCDGSPLLPTDVPSVRIDARTANAGYDWNANGATEAPSPAQDVNFNGRLDAAALRGSDDWSNLLLNQIGSRRNVGALFVPPGAGPNDFAVGPLSVDVGKGDLGKGDLGKGDLGKGDLGKGDLGKGDLGKGDLGKGDLGKGDLGKGDLGGGDLFENDPLNPSGELDYETATELAKTPPNEFFACVVGEDCPAGGPGGRHDVRAEWSAPTVGDVARFTVYRVASPELLPGLEWVAVGEIEAEDGVNLYSIIDSDNLVDGAPYTFFAVATYTDGTVSDPSNLVTITASNDPPTARNDEYTTAEDTPLAPPAPGVLANDDDADSDDVLTAALTAGPQHAAAFTLNPDGSFSYTPAANFNGTDSFSYTANGGAAVSAPATVTIVVTAVNDAPTITAIAAQTIKQNETAGPLAFTIGDPDGVGGLTVSGVSSNLALVPAAGIVFAGAGANRTVTVTPAANAWGTATITVRVSDGTAGAETSFLLTVKGPIYKFVAVANLPPTTTKPGSTTSMQWAYQRDGAVVNSSAVQHTITVCRVTSSGCLFVDRFTNTDAGQSSFRYKNHTWTFNLQTKDRNGVPYPVGEYKLTIEPNDAAYESGGPYQLTIVR